MSRCYPNSHWRKLPHSWRARNAVVSVDTGLSHLTAALDRPNITISARPIRVNWGLR
ncbi:glycosyltransferase family 9 protein [Enterobacter hormaechei]